MVWRLRLPLARSLAVLVVVLGPLALWQGVEPSLPVTGEQSAVGQFGATVTDSQRFTVWRVVAGAALDRPILGWGPGATQSAYLHEATAAEVAATTRLWADAHDLFLETFVTSGLMGLLSLLWVVAIVLPRALACPPERAWALGAAIVLAAFSTVEPVGLVLTPLLFLFAGIAMGPVAAGSAPAGSLGDSWTRRFGAAFLALGFAASCLMLVAAGLQYWADTQGEPWAYRRALDFAPWRISAAESLALRLVSDANAGDPAIAGPAAAQARSVIGDAVAAHPWDPGVRLVAVQVDVFLRDYAGAQAWARQQVARFPSDIDRLRELERAAANPPGA